jgi:hypothetical protein
MVISIDFGLDRTEECIVFCLFLVDGSVVKDCALCLSLNWILLLHF